MKTKFLVAAILLSSCLTSWAWYPRSITQARVDQIHLGQTTENDLLQLFGVPTTRFVDLKQRISLDWFRSVPMPVSGYLPLVGQFLGGLNVEAQQLTVFLSANGRVIRYEVHSSKDRLKPGSTQVTTTTRRETGYSK
ncbi:MAG: hypothetical protein ABI787_03275 [Spartobacteria bacterium]